MNVRDSQAGAPHLQMVAGILHDRVLNALAAAALHVQASVELSGAERQVHRHHLELAQGAIAQAQRDLRDVIDAIRVGTLPATVPAVNLAEQLNEVRAALATWWSVDVAVGLTGPDDALSALLCESVVDIVRETLSNAIRHGRATVASADVQIGRAEVVIDVRDNGRGFAMPGRYDLEALDRLHAGPVTLKQRIASLGGALVLWSSPSGSRLQMSLPRLHP